MAGGGMGKSGVLHARRVLTLTGQEGGSLWWEDGVIRGVGSRGQIDREAPSSLPRQEIPGALVTPGIVDGHTHFGMWGLGRRRVQLAGATTLGEALELVRGGVTEEGWILGQGWDANGWPEPPSRGALDAVREEPTFLESLDVHAAWVNSAALTRAGISRDTPDPEGGRIVRDAAGEPTGLLLERGVELMLPHLPVPSAERLTQALLEAQHAAHRFGVTGIHNVEGLGVLQAFQHLEESDQLRLRVLFHPPVEALPELVARGWRSDGSGTWLSRGGVKLFLDGSLGSRTAWMLEPFEGSADRGMPITGLAQAGTAVRMAAEHGIAATVHAIGDAAVRRALDLLEPLPRVGVPHRIEHFQCVHPSDLARAGRAGIGVSMQPAHLLTDIPLVDRHWGARGAGAYHFRSILEAGNRVVFGSDVPVATLDPRAGIRAALDRDAADGSVRGWHPSERLDLETAVAAYTTAAAWAGGVAGRRGTLAPGMDADLAVWEVDEAAERGGAGAGAAFAAGRCVMTVVAGEVVFAG
ncbi:MAG TPA: amidohydrolase [Gemmatimonadales bacterium]|nr:amidohydrolase [Gemmatimonadales bacterium]